jgi:hypothetical protein
MSALPSDYKRREEDETSGTATEHPEMPSYNLV